jgi:hypothetical protein
MYTNKPWSSLLSPNHGQTHPSKGALQPGIPGLPSPPPLPPLDRSAQPVQPTAQTQPIQLTGPQKFDSLDAKLAVQKAMVSESTLIKFTTLFPCAVAACLNMTNAAQVAFDLTFMQYRFSPMCLQCMKMPRP